MIAEEIFREKIVNRENNAILVKMGSRCNGGYFLSWSLRTIYDEDRGLDREVRL